MIVIPETQSQEKKDTLRALGAELVEVPAVPYSNPNNYVKVAGRMAERLARERCRTARCSPTSSTMSPTATPISTPPARKSGSRPTARSTASSARSAPAARSPASPWRFASASPDIAIALADVARRRALSTIYTTGELKSEGSSITEGIGQGRITANLEGLHVDHASLIPDEESLADRPSPARARKGSALGLSSGVNVAGAIRLARELGPGHTIVTMLCDPATRYQSRLFNPEFLRSKGLPVPPWLEPQKRRRAGFRPVPTITALYQPSEDAYMTLSIGSTAPDFTAETTQGTIHFHDWIGDG